MIKTFCSICGKEVHSYSGFGESGERTINSKDGKSRIRIRNSRISTYKPAYLVEHDICNNCMIRAFRVVRD